MARAFDEAEKIIVEKSLLEAGCTLFGRNGFKRTVIDDIVSMAGVAKGTFYQFWESKEAFFFACMEATENQFQDEVIAPLIAMDQHPAEILGNLMEKTMEAFDQYPMIKQAMDPVLLSHLARKLPPEVLENHQTKDRREFEDIISTWNPEIFNPGIDARVLDGLFKGLLMMNAHRTIIGEEIFPEVIKTTARILTEGLKAISDTRKRNQ